MWPPKFNCQPSWTSPEAVYWGGQKKNWAQRLDLPTILGYWILILVPPWAEVTKVQVYITQLNSSLVQLHGHQSKHAVHLWESIQKQLNDHKLILSSFRPLPYEIILMIFLMCPQGGKLTEAPLLLCRICRLWRNITLEPTALVQPYMHLWWAFQLWNCTTRKIAEALWPCSTPEPFSPSWVLLPSPLWSLRLLHWPIWTRQISLWTLEVHHHISVQQFEYV